MKPKSKPTLKRFIIRKYIMAKSAQDALRIEKKAKPDDVWIDDEWKKENQDAVQSAIGFKS